MFITAVGLEEAALPSREKIKLNLKQTNKGKVDGGNKRRLRVVRGQFLRRMLKKSFSTDLLSSSLEHKFD